MAEGLRTLISGLYSKYLAPDGRGVDYAGLAHDVGFRDYITASAELTKVAGRGSCFLPPSHKPQKLAEHICKSSLSKSADSMLMLQVDLTYMDRRELTAFFINIYNALVIHGMVLFGPAESTLKRYIMPSSA